MLQQHTCSWKLCRMQSRHLHKPLRTSAMKTTSTCPGTFPMSSYFACLSPCSWLLKYVSAQQVWAFADGPWVGAKKRSAWEKTDSVEDFKVPPEKTNRWPSIHILSLSHRAKRGHFKNSSPHSGNKKRKEDIITENIWENPRIACLAECWKLFSPKTSK